MFIRHQLHNTLLENTKLLDTVNHTINTIFRLDAKIGSGIYHLRFFIVTLHQDE